MSAEQLKPCPFCGGGEVKRDFDEATTGVNVNCAKCGTTVNLYSIATWNRRAPAQQGGEVGHITVTIGGATHNLPYGDAGSVRNIPPADNVYAIAMIVAEAAFKAGIGRDRSVPSDLLREIVNSVLKTPPAAGPVEYAQDIVGPMKSATLEERAEFDALYEAMCGKPNSIRTIAWRTWRGGRAYERHTPPAAEPVAMTDTDVRMLHSIAHHLSMRDESPKCAADLQNLAERIQVLIAAKPASEPVGYCTPNDDACIRRRDGLLRCDLPDGAPLYLHPPASPADAVDAGRYRYLRECAMFDQEGSKSNCVATLRFPSFVVKNYDWTLPLWEEPVFSENVDAAIDAAMAQAGGEHG